MEDVTPIRKQYLRLKAQHPDAILFFRLGDFYETFDADAEIAARELDLVLTSRPVAKGVRVPMAGVPHHAVENYIARLIEKGYRVAIAEQVGEVTGRGLVEREVVRVVTPGTVVEPALLDARRPNYLAALVVEEDRAGLAYAEITTGEFATTQLAREEVPRELARLQPRECLYPDAREWKSAGPAGPPLPELNFPGIHFTPCPAYRFEPGTARQSLLDHFGVTTLEGFGCEGKPLAVRAAGAILQYLRETQKGALAQLTTLRTYSTDRFLVMDPTTRRNLELTESLRERRVQGSLLGVLDRTLTPMGGRLLRARIAQPLVDREAIERRLDEVEQFVQDGILRARVREALKDMPDLERLVNRVVGGVANPRDLVGIRRALEAASSLLPLTPSPLLTEGQERGGGSGEAAGGGVRTLTPTPLAPSPSPPKWERGRGQPPSAAGEEVRDLIARALVDDPPASLSEGGVIRPGFSAELDGLLRSVREAREWLASLERREQERTGIKNLKVGYNKVFGYYIEVTKANLPAVPPDYIRKQTLVNAERFITPELKEMETIILNAEERQVEVETRIFREVCARIAARAPALLEMARAVARLDVAAALAEVAVRNRYVRPELTDENALEIVGGRHPIVEQTLSEPFVPNDLRLDEETRILIITGPNMAGKCLEADTFIFTQKGMVPIGSLRPECTAHHTFSPFQIRVAGPTGNCLTSHFYDGGTASALRVRTRMGFELAGTPDHYLWARRPDGSEGWVRLEDLTPEDYVALKPGTNLWGEAVALSVPPMHVRSAIRYRCPDHISPDLAYFIGLLIGDGSLSHPMRVSITTADAFVGEEFCRIAREIFGYEPVVVSKKGSAALDYVIASADIRLYLQQLGLGLIRSYEKEVPSVILRAPREMVVAFLQGLFDTDGYADRRYGNIELSTASPRLAQEIQLLLLNLGIVSSLHLKKTRRRPAYRLSIRGEDAIRFYERVGFRLPRKQERRALCSALRMPNGGGIPYLEQTLKTVQKRIAGTEGKPQALKKAKRIRSIFYTYVPNQRNVSYQKLAELVAYCRQNGVPCPELESLLARRYFYDRVVAVEPAGEQPVCDLSVPEGHAYIAAGFVSHNSVYLRQNALIVLMAQMGSFVPAERARIGIVDRIFTRIGAQDEVASGQSTFMVEMVETANILNNATPRSLLILDEIGRGTSTYDGISIAWAVVEYLHNHPQRRARTLFATHYHELIELADRLPGVRNVNLAVAEEGGQVVFLHQVVPGGADRSYGIHVAQLAGVPRPVIQRAQELLGGLESGKFRPGTPAPRPYQPVLFADEHPVVEELRKLDISQMTPLEAINKLYELQQKVGKDTGPKRRGR